MKNLYKSFLVSAFVLIFSILISHTVYAVTPTNSSASTPIHIQSAAITADVDILNAKIISQQGNTFNIIFDLRNGKGVQTGVKYGVELLSGAKNEKIADTKVYDESLTLPENSLIERRITYTVPTINYRSYALVLV